MLERYNDKDALGIHPDGGIFGTKGCIGADANDTSDLFDALEGDNGPLTVLD